MQFLEGIIAIVLSTLLLIPIITVSQSIRTVFEKIEVINIDLALEISLAKIPRQTLADSEALLSEVTRILSSNRVEWSKIELLSKQNGRIMVENKQASGNLGEHHTRLVRIIRVSSEDIVCIVVSVEK
ncbi:MAG: hypothetical protein FGF53_00470 [Candidatus Brockarchaeota archaeon]|nr:hypothetical protein [Candidatus Brockarchaeota archaeon]MBO3808620.1 hypothetical protein [Candidatus Brockarchaeota archaeon]